MWIDNGDTVLQLGAGVGCFTAILSYLVGSKGHVFAYEIEEPLAQRASENLTHLSNVSIVFGDAVHAGDLPQLDHVIAFAGATHPPLNWLDRLSSNGRMMLPLTAADHKGFMMLLEREGGRYLVRSLGPCGYYHCNSARSENESKALQNALEGDFQGLKQIEELRVGQPPSQASECWYAGNNFWITKRSRQAA
ncbi:MAG: hypothetical protein AAFR21_16535 [Pseudomonadota bacterium]